MTAVVAMSSGGKVYMAGDSFCGDADKRDACLDSKVYKVGPLGVGLCGHVRQELILERVLRDNLECVSPVTMSHEWIKFELPDLVMKEMKDRNAVVDDDTNQATLGESAYMIAFDGHIYYLEDAFCIWESSRPFAAIGIGSQYALAALDALVTYGKKSSPEKTLHRALRITAKWNPWVIPPYTYIEV